MYNLLFFSFADQPIVAEEDETENMTSSTTVESKTQLTTTTMTTMEEEEEEEECPAAVLSLTLKHQDPAPPCALEQTLKDCSQQRTFVTSIEREVPRRRYYTRDVNLPWIYVALDCLGCLANA